MGTLEDLKNYMEEKYGDYKYVSTEYKVPNKIHIKPIKLGFKPQQVEEFNEFYCNYFLPCYNDDNYVWGSLKLTPSQALSRCQIPTFPSMTYIYHAKTAIEFVIHLGMIWYRIELNVVFSNKGEKNKITGTTAFRKFNEICKEFNVDLTKYLVDKETGLNIKKTIPKLKIELFDESVVGKVIYNLNHMDLNSSFMSGVAVGYPEVAPPINYVYGLRKSGDEEANALYKAVLTNTYGFCQSEYFKIDEVKYPYGLAPFAKQAIEFNNKYLDDMTKKLLKNGNKVISYNIDGIWYSGDVYHDENEGTGLGQWKNDVVNAIGIFKGCGAYQYITYDGDKEIVHTVLKGTCDLEKYKPRDEWYFGEIMTYGAEEKKYKFVKDKGIITVGEKENEKNL